jgi:hypothetical protein
MYRRACGLEENMNRTELVERLLAATQMPYAVRKVVDNRISIAREAIHDQLTAVADVKPSTAMGFEAEKRLPWDEERLSMDTEIHEHIAKSLIDNPDLTDEDLQTACVFYESPVGVRYVSARMSMIREINELTSAYLSKMRAMLLDEMLRLWKETHGKIGEA